MLQNRRVHTRIDYRQPVHVVSEDGLVACPATDVGEGGLGLRTLSPLPWHQSLKVFFPLPDPVTGKVHLAFAMGEIAWREGEQLGVQFLDLSDELRDHLARLVSGS